MTIATTKAEREYCLAIRRAVFIQEQGVPESIEIDEFENVCTHFILMIDGTPAATGRLRPKPPHLKFERIATLPSHRGMGLGRELMLVMQAFAANQYPNLMPMMHAQEDALSFYRKLGWQVQGERFVEADIGHYRMVFTSTN